AVVAVEGVGGGRLGAEGRVAVDAEGDVGDRAVGPGDDGDVLSRQGVEVDRFAVNQVLDGRAVAGVHQGEAGDGADASARIGRRRGRRGRGRGGWRGRVRRRGGGVDVLERHLDAELGAAGPVVGGGGG